MRSTLLAIFALVASAAAAPVPRPESEAAAFAKRFGVAVLPEKQGAFKLVGDQLTASFPKGVHVGHQDHPLLCPHLERNVVGDFEMTVGVRLTGPKTPPDTGKQWDMGGGLVAWDASAEKEPELPVTVDVARKFDSDPLADGGGDAWRERTPAHVLRNVYSPEAVVATAPTVTRYLRLTRSGDTFTASVSEDQKAWVKLHEREAEVGKTVRAGVWAYKRVDGAGEVVFEEFSLTTPK